MNDTVSSATELNAMSIAEILEALPHRYPFLMIDRIVDIDGDKSAISVKNVTYNEPIFTGHFPGNPIFPGVLIIEGMAQTAGAIVIKHDSNGGQKNIVLMLGIDNARFRKPAGPGDTIEFHISKMHRRRNVGRYKAEAKVNGTIIAEAEITAMIVGAGFVIAPVVHPTAIVAEGASLGSGVRIGPYSIVGPKVVIGDDVELVSHAVVEGNTSVGAGTRIFPFASIGHEPQDLKFHGENSRLEIGERCTIREAVTINPGTEAGGMLTKVGNDCLIMANAHVAHDAIVGNNVIMANYVGLAGHVIVGDNVIFGGTCVVHQRTRIGAHAFIGAHSMIDGDVIPYGMALGNRAVLNGLNLVGLKRRAFERDAIHRLRAAYRQIFASEGTLRERVEDAAELFKDDPLVQDVVTFIAEATDRPILLPRNGHERD